MLKTRAKTCARCCHSGHPARNFERGAGPCLQNADVTKPHYRGGCAALRKVFSSTGPGQGLRRLWHGVVVPGQALSVWLVGLYVVRTGLAPGFWGVLVNLFGGTIKTC